MSRPVITVLAIVAVFGVLLPWFKRYDFLDPVLLAAYFCLPLVLVAPMAADALAGSAETGFGTVRSVLLVALYGWGLGIVVIGAGLATVNAVAWHGHLLTPGYPYLGAGALSSAMSALAAVIVTGALAHRFSAKVAKTALRLAFLAALVAIVLLVRTASPETTTAFWRHTTSTELTRLGYWIGALLAVADGAGLWALSRIRRVG